MAGFPVVLSCMNIPHFSLPIHLLKDVRLFPYPGYCEWRCYECWHTNTGSCPCCEHLGIYLEFELLGHTASVFRFFMFPPSMHKCPNFSVSSPPFVYSFFFSSVVVASNPSECKAVFHCGLDFIALMVNDVEYCFMCLLAIRIIYLLWRNVCSSPFLI